MTRRDLAMAIIGTLFFVALAVGSNPALADEPVLDARMPIMSAYTVGLAEPDPNAAYETLAWAMAAAAYEAVGPWPVNGGDEREIMLAGAQELDGMTLSQVESYLDRDGKVEILSSLASGQDDLLGLEFRFVIRLWNRYDTDLSGVRFRATLYSAERQVPWHEGVIYLKPRGGITPGVHEFDNTASVASEWTIAYRQIPSNETPLLRLELIEAHGPDGRLMRAER